jgi:hypothetical protein
MASVLEWRKSTTNPPVTVPTYPSSVRWAGTVTGYLELGYLITDHVGVAAQGRWEWIQSEGSGDNSGGSPATRAVSLLGRGLYYLDLGTGNAQLQFSADLGGGDGYRFAFPPTNTSNPPKAVPDPTRTDGRCLFSPKTTDCVPQPTVVTDTVRSGPFIYGAGFGFIYHFNSHFAANAELRVLGAGPHFGLLAEGYATLQFAIGGKAPEQAGDAPLPEEDAGD